MATEVTNEELLSLSAEGKTPTEIGEMFGLTPQKIGSMIRKAKAIADIDAEDDTDGDDTPPEQPKAKKVVVIAEVEKNEVADAGNKITIRTAEDYFEYQKSQGRTAFGGKIGEKIPISVEELRAYINSKWTPSMVMEKYQLTVDDLQQAVWKLSKKELREKPISFNIKHNVFKS